MWNCCHDDQTLGFTRYIKTLYLELVTRQSWSHLLTKWPKFNWVYNICLRFAVFALGSTAYPKFCAFGKWLDLALKRLGGTRLGQIGLGDELGDRDGEFNMWMNAVYEEPNL